MFLSVSMPIYNAEKFLEESISSVMNQTEQDFELILVDDGSKDRSLEIARSWVNKYPSKIRLIESNNQGSLLARRCCIKESIGDYIYIMDADDYLIDNNAFLKIKNTIMESQCDLVVFEADSSYKETSVGVGEFKNSSLLIGDLKCKFYEIFIETDEFNSLWNKVFKRDLVDWEQNYSVYTNVTNGTDLFQVIPIVFRAKKIYYLKEKLYYYRVQDNNSSIIHIFKPTIYFSLRESFNRLSQYARESEFWSNDWERRLNKRYMKIVSTAIFKARLLPKTEKKQCIDYFEMIYEDEMFKKYSNNFKYFDVSFPRALIILMLKNKKFNLLYFLISLF